MLKYLSLWLTKGRLPDLETGKQAQFFIKCQLGVDSYLVEPFWTKTNDIYFSFSYFLYLILITYCYIANLSWRTVTIFPVLKYCQHVRI